MAVILPVLLETFATGSVAAVVGMAVWQLFKHEKLTKKEPHPEDLQIQSKTSAPPLQTEPSVSVAESAPADVVKTITEEPEEEPMLKRHYLNNVRMMLMETTFPHPTDSMLSRHYEEMIDAKAEECLADENKMARLVEEYEGCQCAKAQSEAYSAEALAESDEEEPMLKRHYMHNVRMMLVSTTFPRPTDSMLSRHYDEMIDAKAEDCLADEGKMARLTAEYEACQMAEVLPETEKTIKVKLAVPQDSILKRHFLSKLKSDIENVKGCFRPTDSMLVRHYDAMINSELANYIH